jgi:hypothetical protein
VRKPSYHSRDSEQDREEVVRESCQHPSACVDMNQIPSPRTHRAVYQPAENMFLRLKNEENNGNIHLL